MDYYYRMIQAYVCQVALDLAMEYRSIPPSIWDLTPINLYYAISALDPQSDDQDWW